MWFIYFKDYICSNGEKITLLNSCSLSENMSPPLKNAHPRTSSMLDKIEPSSDCWTTRIMPLLNAWIDIINSVAFPKVAFRRPPTAKLKRKYLKWSKLKIIISCHKVKEHISVEDGNDSFHSGFHCKQLSITSTPKCMGWYIVVGMIYPRLIVHEQERFLLIIEKKVDVLSSEPWRVT